MRRRIAVIGAGWAGCAAAVTLAQCQYHVTVFESARIPGGRARAVDLGGIRFDNGQHILLGAYRDSLRLMKLVGVDRRSSLLRIPLQMRYPDTTGMRFIAARLPAPLHLLIAVLRSQGFTREDKLALLRFSTSARWMGWRLNQDCSVAELMQRFDQTDTLVHLLWQPLCVAALNTPIEHASAQVFLAVLRDSFGARRAASDMLIPRINLSDLFPRPALDFVRAHDGQVRLGETVKQITAHNSDNTGDGWSLQVSNQANQTLDFDAIIVATGAPAAARLLHGIADTDALIALRHEPITTCYLQYAPQTRLTQPFFALESNPDEHQFGQFVFDRGQLAADQAGWLTVVISTSSAALALDHQELAAALARQLATAFQLPALAAPCSSYIISEKRASFSCQSGLTRPTNHSNREHLFLAGDYTAGEYPSTLEGAVRSGIAAAKLVASNK